MSLVKKINAIVEIFQSTLNLISMTEKEEAEVKAALEFFLSDKDESIEKKVLKNYAVEIFHKLEKESLDSRKIHVLGEEIFKVYVAGVEDGRRESGEKVKR